jgi:hypothetical protein
MTKDEALKMAIEYIENQEIKLSFDNLKAKADALNACYKALEQPAQEPDPRQNVQGYINPEGYRKEKNRG